MSEERCQKDSISGTKLASIDIGSHTARLLVSEKIGPPGLIRPLLRKRAYIRLAEDFNLEGKETIRPEAVERTLKALEDFASIVRGFRVESTHAVCTGVVREAENRDDFLSLIYDHTGIKAKVISGEKEARLTEKGVLHSLNIEGGPFMIFDLGGGSTEFVYGEQEDRRVKSIPLGAMVLTQRHLSSDPPEDKQIGALIGEVDGVLQEAFPENAYSGGDGLLVGTGGTVTSLAAMIHDIDVEKISPDRMNGLILRRQHLEGLFVQMKTMTIDERIKLPGLDRGRADVILAGCMVVIRILHFFKSLQLVVSLSDLLEGIMIAYLKGEKDG